MSRVTPEEIQALVDGELSEADAERVIAAIAEDPAAAAELEDALQMRSLAHELAIAEGSTGGAETPRTASAEAKAEASAPPSATIETSEIASTEAPRVASIEVRRSTTADAKGDAARDARAETSGAARDARAEARAAGDELARARRRRRWIAVIAPAIAAAAVGYCAARRPGEQRGVEAEVVAALAPSRAAEPRLAWGPAGRHRPYDTMRAGPPAAAGPDRRPAPRSEALSFELLAKIEASGEPSALVAANVLSGNLERAEQALERASESADGWSDRAAIALLRGDPEAALLAADRALALRADHAAAAWNRALALAGLGLDRTAAAAFRRIAERGEPGWADEARTRADALEAQRRRKDAAYRAAVDALEAMARGGPVAMDQAEALPGLARLYLYDAVRGAASPERVRQLEPLAKALDARAGGDALARYVARVGGMDFEKRALLARRYEEARRGTGDRAAMVRDAAGAGVEDIRLGAMLQAGVGPAEVAAYEALAQASGDPWFTLLAAEQRAGAALAQGDVAGAEAALRAVRCEEGLAYRCQRIARLQTHVYLVMQRVAAAKAAWERSRRAAQRGGTPVQEDELLWFAGRIAAMEDTIGGSRYGVARAYLEEWALTGGGCTREQDARAAIAQLLINQGRLDAARTYLAGQPACEAPPTLEHVFVRAQLARDRDEALLRDIAALRQGASAGLGALLDHIEGRVVVLRDREAGRALLRRALGAKGDDAYSAQARSYSASVLVQDAARSGEWDAALAVLAEERGGTAPARCALGAAAEESAVFVARGPDGGAGGAIVPLAAGQLPGSAGVPAEVARRLEGCDVVDVYARQPYYGRPDLLPGALAVRFRASGGPLGAPGSGPLVVVGNVAAPAELGLPALQPIEPPAGAVMIEGAEATPARVLNAMRTAGFVELHSHGLVGHGEEDAGLLVLSPGTDGRYALAAGDVARTRLTARPVVVLAACDAGATGRAFHATWGLADALVAAGASAVIASPAAIGDAAAPRFFAAVRARIQRGSGAAEALRDERAAWRDPAQRAWIDRLVVFQ